MKKLLLAVTLLTTACGANIFEPMATKDGDRVLMEEARILIDEKNYAEADRKLADVKADSNEKRILQTSALLGASGLTIWSIILDIVDQTTNTSGSGVDNFFNLITEAIIGTGDEQVGRLAALDTSLDLLGGAPNPEETRVDVLRCFLAGLRAQPTITAGTAAISNIAASLEAVSSSAQGGGTTAADCPNLDDLNASFAQLGAVQAAFQKVLTAAADCKLFDFSDSASDLNAIEQSFQRLTANADVGCSAAPSCGSSAACEALQLGCVQEMTAEAGAVAGDGVIASCEFMQNCLDPSTCFGGAS